MVDRLQRGDALLIVDMQNDFCPGGALPVPEGDRVVAVLNGWIEQARRAGVTIVASRDWHPADHVSFSSRGGPWPAHCVADSPGAAFHPELGVPDNAVIVSKGPEPDREAYSAFQGTALAARLKEGGVRRLWVGGLALDYCVRDTVLDGLAEGFAVHVLLSATRPVDVNPGDGQRALQEMESAGALIEGDAS